MGQGLQTQGQGLLCPSLQGSWWVARALQALSALSLHSFFFATQKDALHLAGKVPASVWGPISHISPFQLKRV